MKAAGVCSILISALHVLSQPVSNDAPTINGSSSNLNDARTFHGTTIRPIRHGDWTFYIEVQFNERFNEGAGASIDTATEEFFRDLPPNQPISAPGTYVTYNGEFGRLRSEFNLLGQTQPPTLTTISIQALAKELDELITFTLGTSIDAHPMQIEAGKMNRVFMRWTVEKEEEQDDMRSVSLGGPGAEIMPWPERTLPKGPVRAVLSAIDNRCVQEIRAGGPDAVVPCQATITIRRGGVTLLYDDGGDPHPSQRVTWKTVQTLFWQVQKLYEQPPGRIWKGRDWGQVHGEVNLNDPDDSYVGQFKIIRDPESPQDNVLEPDPSLVS